MPAAINTKTCEINDDEHAVARAARTRPTQMTPVASYIHDMSAELKSSTQFGGA